MVGVQGSWRQRLLEQTATGSALETMTLGSRWAAFLPRGSVLACEGPLGAGKTTFIKGLVDALGVAAADAVVSPTFTYLHIYGDCDGGYGQGEGHEEQGRSLRCLYHFDLYRLRSEEDFLSMGFDDFLEDPRAIACIEWSERIADLLPAKHYRLELEHIAPEERKLTLWQMERCHHDS